MLRKLFITLAGSLPRDPYIQIMSALVILVGSLTLQALVQPYASRMLNLLDVGSLFILLVTQVRFSFLFVALIFLLFAWFCSLLFLISSFLPLPLHSARGAGAVHHVPLPRRDGSRLNPVRDVEERSRNVDDHCALPPQRLCHYVRRVLCTWMHPSRRVPLQRICAARTHSSRADSLCSDAEQGRLLPSVCLRSPRLHHRPLSQHAVHRICAKDGVREGPRSARQAAANAHGG